MTSPQPRPCWIAGKAEPGTGPGSGEIVVRHPYDGSEIARVSAPGGEQIENAVATAAALAPEFRATPTHLRAAALQHVSSRLAERAEEVAETIVAENGKPLKWARIEVSRAVSTFRFAAEEARRFGGDWLPLDTDPSAEGRLAVVRRVPRGPVLGISPFNFPLNLVAHKVAPALAVVRRFPRGPVLGISPFNFPLNLVAHKIAPALAVGAPIVVKPAPKTPLSALVLGELLAETDLPGALYSVLPVPNERAGDLVAAPRLPVVSFTGSGPVGWGIRDRVPRKHVTLELGGNAAVVVCPDWTDEEWLATRVATFSNYQAGQSCIAVQRVYLPADRYDALAARIVAAVEGLRTGDPAEESTDVGPMISEEAAERVERWVAEAVAAGARVLTGGRREGSSYAPTVLAEAPPDAKVVAEEVFGPVLVLARYTELAEAFDLVNASEYGLQAGVFTRDQAVAFRAHRELRVGGVIVGDVPSYRADQMPYGGAKQSGVGREGVRYAMEDLSYERVLVLTGLDL